MKYVFYVMTNRGDYLVHVPDRDRVYYLADDDQTWDGGDGVCESWIKVKASEVPVAERKRLGPLWHYATDKTTASAVEAREDCE